MAKKITVEVIDGVEGKSLYVNDYRVCGPKPWGGGEAIEHFEVDEERMCDALKRNISFTIKRKSENKQ